MQGPVPGCNTFVEVKAEVEEGEEGRFADPELPYRASEDGKKRDVYPGLPSRADEALKTRERRREKVDYLTTRFLPFKYAFASPSVAALKQVLMTQLMSQEATQQNKRSTGPRLLRTTSLRTPVDSCTRVTVHNGSEKTSPKLEEAAQDLGSRDKGFFDTPEDYGEQTHTHTHTEKRCDLS